MCLCVGGGGVEVIIKRSSELLRTQCGVIRQYHAVFIGSFMKLVFCAIIDIMNASASKKD